MNEQASGSFIGGGATAVFFAFFDIVGVFVGLRRGCEVGAIGSAVPRTLKEPKALTKFFGLQTTRKNRSERKASKMLASYIYSVVTSL